MYFKCHVQGRNRKHLKKLGGMSKKGLMIGLLYDYCIYAKRALLGWNEAYSLPICWGMAPGSCVPAEVYIKDREYDFL